MGESVEEAVEHLERQMLKADEKLDTLALQVGSIEHEIFSEDGTRVEVYSLLKSVTEVKTNYQNLRKEIMEVQDLQKQLSSSLQVQLKTIQGNVNLLKEKLSVNVPQKSDSVPKIMLIPCTPNGKANETNY